MQHRFLGVLCIAFVATACNESSAPTVTGPRPPKGGVSAARATAMRSARDILTTGENRAGENDLLELEDKTPGFGGFFIDSGGSLSAWVTPEADTTAVKANLLQYALARPHLRYTDDGRARGVSLRKGKYSFSSLVNWHQIARDNWALADNIQLLDADEALNQLRIGVKDEKDEAALLDKFTKLGIPSSAITFQNYAGTFTQRAQTTDNARPIHGGIEIGRWSSPGSGTACTLGFIVTHPNGTRYILTNSHCTGSYTGNVYNTWFQNPWGGQVGTEAVNPPWWTVGCAPGATYCEQADAALIAIDAGVASEKTVVETWIVGSGDNAAGTTTIGNTWTLGAYSDGWSGDEVYHTGFNGGTTKGPITGTCVSLPAYGGYPPVSMQCQYEVQSRLLAGDSGAPVYVWHAPLIGSSRLALGIAHSEFKGPYVFQHYMSYYSPMSLIMNRLGIYYPI